MTDVLRSQIPIKLHSLIDASHLNAPDLEDPCIDRVGENALSRNIKESEKKFPDFPDPRRYLIGFFLG